MTSTIDIAALRRKYEAIIVLRTTSGQVGESDPRAAMVALADEFPGALRETDEMAMADLHGRALALDEVLAGRRAPDRWMEATARFHALVRGALSAKRWLAGRRTIDGDARRSFASAVPTLRHPRDAAMWSDALDELAKPARGRISAVVFARMAKEAGHPPDELQALVFPSRASRVRSPAGSKNH